MCARCMWKNPIEARAWPGEMLRRVCEDMKEQQIDLLYLVTDHIGFYERYGWEFLCMVREESGRDTRMYIHREGNRL